MRKPMGKPMGSFVKRSSDFNRIVFTAQHDDKFLIRLNKWCRWHRWRRAAVTCAIAGTALCCLAPASLAQDAQDTIPAAENLLDTPSAQPSAEYSVASESVPLFHSLTQQSLSEARSLFPLQQPQAQAEPDEPGKPLQSEMTPADQQVMEELVSIAISNAPAVRDARAAMGIAPFLDAFVIEIAPSRLSSTLNDASVGPDPYRFSDNSTTSTFTFNPIQLINGVQQMPALQSHLRDAEQQTRVAVVQSYVAYVQARQTSAVSARELDTVVATILQESQIASASLEQIPISSLLANNDSYIAAATESLVANSDEMVALETLAATVGLPTQDMLTVIDGVVTQADGEQPTAAASVEQPNDLEQPSPAVLIVDTE
jgi:hypothetical protein